MEPTLKELSPAKKPLCSQCKFPIFPFRRESTCLICLARWRALRNTGGSANSGSDPDPEWEPAEF